MFIFNYIIISIIMKEQFQKISNLLQKKTQLTQSRIGGYIDYDINEIGDNQLEVYRTPYTDFKNIKDEDDDYYSDYEGDSQDYEKESFKEFIKLEKSDDKNTLKLSLWQTLTQVIDKKRDAINKYNELTKIYNKNKNLGCTVVHDDYVDYHAILINCPGDVKEINYNYKNPNTKEVVDKIVEISKKTTEKFKI